MSSDRGQALVEFALGLPILLLAAFYAFAVLDAAATQQAADAAARRAAMALAGANDDAQAAGAAASTAWLRGQAIALTITPDGSQRRCAGTPVTIVLSAPGHLGFLLPVPAAWRATADAMIEAEGPQAEACSPPP